MHGLAETLTRLASLRTELERLAHGVTHPGEGARTDSPLRESADFGSNPGGLRMLSHVPAGVGPGAPLVVALHGCTQTAADYDWGSGWSALAERHRFALLMPQQRSLNNPNRCFTWFQTGDTRRNSGEALSIRQMVGHLADVHGLDPARVYVAGLSAGGAMTAALLAAYPDVFAAGAVIAGLPAGAASSASEAFEAMAHGRKRPARQWGDLVRQSAPVGAAWPRVAIFHGEADKVVAIDNAEQLVLQWTDVHGLAPEPATDIRMGAVRRRGWRDAGGRPVIEAVTIAGLGHGVPLAPGAGHVSAYHFDVGVASTAEIAAFFGLARQEQHATAAPAVAAAAPACEPPLPAVHEGRLHRLLRRIGIAR